MQFVSTELKRCSSSVSVASRVLTLLVLAFFLLAGNAWAQITCPHKFPDSPTDEDVLKKLYCDTKGDSWGGHTVNWGDSDLNSWYGVTAKGTEVTHLNLSSNNLNGSIPSELGNLSSLIELVLSRNQLSGTIPSSLGNLTNLKNLSLSVNNLSGAIPPSLGNLINLQNLSLNVNNLSGAIPPSLGNLTNLQTIVLDKNQLSGMIPPSLGNLTRLVNHLWLNDNRLSGEIPPSLGNLTRLRTLNLSGNSGITGELPLELSRLSTLATLNVKCTGVSVPDNQDFMTWLSSTAFHLFIYI